MTLGHSGQCRRRVYTAAACVWPLLDLQGLSEPVAEQCALLGVCGLDGRSIKRAPPPLSYQLTALASSAPEAALVGGVG